ncbi:MAG: SPOR domain-containing protein [Bdellovibrionales bacterium]
MAGKSETFIKLGLVFFIALLSFSVGTLVGKQYSDRQYKLSKMEPGEHESQDRKVASESHDSSPTQTGPKSKLTDEEIAKLAEEFVTDDTVEQAKSEGMATVPAIETQAPTVAQKDFDEMNDEALQAAQRIIENKLPVAASQRGVAATSTPEKKSQAPQMIPQNAAQDDAGKYTVQVGSYVKETEARQRAEGLKAKGYPAFYVPGVVEGKTFYRVNVGTYSTLSDAKVAVEKIANDSNGERGFIKEIR